MAFTPDVVSHATPVVGANGDISWNHTCAAGANKLVIQIGAGAGAGAVDRRNVASVTYNGVSCSQIGEVDDGNFEHGELWQLNNPPTGSSFAIVVTMVGTGDINDQTVAGAVSFFDADPIVGAPSTNTTTSTNPVVTVADTLVGDFVIALAVSDSGNLATLTQNGTLLWEDEDYGGGDSDANAQSKIAIGKNTVCSWICSSSQLWCAIGVAIRPLGRNIPRERSRSAFNPAYDAVDEGRFNELDVRNWWCEAFA